MGILTGVLAGLVVGMILLKVTKKDGTMKCKYDERQEAIRGRGYKYGFFTFMICLFLYAMLHVAGLQIPVDMSVILVGIIVIAVSVQIVYCIWNDAYFSLNENRQRIMAVFLVLAVFNLLISLIAVHRGEMVEHGVVTFRCMNLLCAVLFLTVFGALLAKKLQKQTNAEEE